LKQQVLENEKAHKKGKPSQTIAENLKKHIFELESHIETLKFEKDKSDAEFIQ